MSKLEQDLVDYLQLRQSLGHDLAESHWKLPGLVSYLDARGSTTITTQLALEWAQQPAPRQGASEGPRRMTAARGFARYLSGIYPNTEVPPLGLLPYHQRWRLPFIYSTADITALMSQIRASMPQPLRAATYETLIGLLAATGMRIGEAIKLDRKDVDWKEGMLLIRESKFGKSRLIPLQESAIEALKAYDSLHDALQSSSLDPSFFVSLIRRRLGYPNVSQTFRRLVTSAGIGTDAPSSPRLHDLRHTFAINTLLGWYRSDEDVQARIPSLSTYLGHREPASTYWYLSAAPELLALAAARQSTHWIKARS